MDNLAEDIFQNRFMCRACLDSESIPSIPMSRKSLDKDKTNAEIYEYITNLKVPNEHICDNCLIGLYFCYKFKNKCLKSDAELEQRFLLNFEIQPTNKSEPEIKTEHVIVKTEKNESEKSLIKNCDNNKNVRKSPKLANSTEIQKKPDSKEPIKSLHLNFKCKYCSRSFFKGKWLENHLRKHHNKKVLVISDKKMFRERKKPPIKEEPIKEIVEPPKPPKVLEKIPKLNCKYCRKRFSKIKAYTIHVKSKICFLQPKPKPKLALNGTSSSKHCCKKCNKSFMNISGLNYHLNNNVCDVKQETATEKPEPEKPPKKYVCTVCRRSFNQLKGLDYHMSNKVCTKEREKVGYRCKTCKKKFINLSGLQYHNEHQVCSKRTSTEDAPEN